jgi:hypothetical protein
MGGIWGRELSNVQRAAGWKMLHLIADIAVEKAVDAIATDGREMLPPWPMVYKAAVAIASAERDLRPALPAGDALSDQEHAAAMIRLRAKETPEQRRRADRMTRETKGLPMMARLVLAKELLVDYAKVDASSWDRVFDERLAAAEAKVPVQREIFA